MKLGTSIVAGILMLGWVMAFSMPSLADEKANKAEGEKPKSQLFSYKPPLRGAPGNRIGGGTRGAGDTLPELMVLVPDHTGLTTQSQPSLYWYLSESATTPIEFTLNDEEAGKTLVQKDLGKSFRKGLHCLKLSDYGVTLSPYVSYRWFVSLVVDPDQPSKNIYAGGIIERVEPSKSLTANLAKGDKKEIAALYAQEGIWYDSLSTLSELIDASPRDKILREQRASLLEQVGLSDIADFD